MLWWEEAWTDLWEVQGWCPIDPNSKIMRIDLVIIIIDLIIKITKWSVNSTKVEEHHLSGTHPTLGNYYIIILLLIKYNY